MWYSLWPLANYRETAVLNEGRVFWGPLQNTVMSITENKWWFTPQRSRAELLRLWRNVCWVLVTCIETTTKQSHTKWPNCPNRRRKNRHGNNTLNSPLSRPTLETVLYVCALPDTFFVKSLRGQWLKNERWFNDNVVYLHVLFVLFSLTKGIMQIRKQCRHAKHVLNSNCMVHLPILQSRFECPGYSRLI